VRPDENDVTGHIEDLRRSREIDGELNPIKVDQFDRVIDGRKRKLAGWKSKQVIQVSDDLDFLHKRISSMLHWPTSESDWIEVFTRICIIRSQSMPEQAVCAYVSKHDSPFSEQRTRELVPDRFKRSGGYDLPERKPVSFVDAPQVVGGYKITPTPLPAERAALEWPCAHCGCPADWRKAVWSKPKAST
jgi:hypothetical protein